MKTFVTSKWNYKDELEAGEQYEVVTSFVTDKVRSGLAIVIDTEDALLVYDSGFFHINDSDAAYSEMQHALSEIVDYLKPTKELMNDEFRAILIKAEQAIENATSK